MANIKRAAGWSPVPDLHEVDISSRSYPSAQRRGARRCASPRALVRVPQPTSSTTYVVERAFVPEDVEGTTHRARWPIVVVARLARAGLATLSLVCGEVTLTLRRRERSLRQRGSRVVRLGSGDGGSS